MSPAPNRTGVMVVRIWLDEDDGGLRARLTETPDIATRAETTRAAASADDVLGIVREWLEEFLGAAGG